MNELTGAGRGISAAIRAAFRKRYLVTLLYVHDLDGIPEVAPDPACRIELLGEERAHLLMEVDQIDLEQVRARFRRGDLCYLGLLDGRPAHFNWTQASGSHPASGTGRSFHVKDGEVWLYSGHTAAWARGRRLQPAAMTRMLSDAKQKGISRAWTYIRETNAASRKSAERVGFRVFRRLRSVGISRYCLPLP